MINITINKKNGTIECVGHAQFDEKGKDIVCAGVSTLMYGLVNHYQKIREIELKEKEKNKKQYVTQIDVDKENGIKIRYNHRTITNIVKINMFEDMVRTIAEEYSDYITLKVQEITQKSVKLKYD